MAKNKSFFSSDYTLMQMVAIGLAVLSIGLAIAFVGYVLVNR